MKKSDLVEIKKKLFKNKRVTVMCSEKRVYLVRGVTGDHIIVKRHYALVKPIHYAEAELFPRTVTGV